MSKLLLALAASSALVLAAATPALSAPHTGWDTTTVQGGSTNDCNTNPGCTTTEQPKGQTDKTGNSSPKECSGPAGQCK
jgi:hypothetical protein